MGSSELLTSIWELFFDKTSFLWFKKKLTMSFVDSMLETIVFSLGISWEALNNVSQINNIFLLVPFVLSLGFAFLHFWGIGL